MNKKNDAQLFTICKDVIYKTIDNDVFLLRPENSTVHSLNTTASEIWSLLVESDRSIAEIAKILSESYDANLKDIKEDVRQVITHLTKNNFIKSTKNKD